MSSDLLQEFQTKRALDLEKVIRIASDELASLMQRIHGGSYRVRIDHQRGIISVRPA